ncbi:MAG: NAD(P)-dependent oxidoreductase [Myxococcota bacterium]
MSEDRSLAAEQEVGRINAFFPILPRLGNHWAATRPWEGLTIALNLHLTSLTASLVRELSLGGGQFVLTAANPRTTDSASVDLLRNLGFTVYTGGDMEDRYLQTLEHEPHFIVDTGFDLIETLLERSRTGLDNVKAAVEITRQGITKLQLRGSTPFPVVNINDGRLRDRVENRHGVGEAIWQAVGQTTGMHLAGRRVLVVGYGPVGRGLARYAAAAGMSVEVCDTDPVRRLFAHYDGYPTPTLEDGLKRAGLLVTATGRRDAVTVDHLAYARDGIVLVNAGHGGDEFDVAGIRRAATNRDHISDQVARYQLQNGRHVTVLGDGHPLNIVLNSGSPEPVLLHFAVLGLTLEWLTSQPDLRPGEVSIPDDIENRAARFALQALDPSIHG